jgi:hypothetical protein
MVADHMALYERITNSAASARRRSESRVVA